MFPFEPNIKKSKQYIEAQDWVKQFLDTHLKDGTEPDEKSADLAYSLASAEMDDCKAAFASLTTKATDLMRMQATIMAASLAIWKFSQPVKQAQQIQQAQQVQQVQQTAWELASNWTAAAAMGIFLLAMIYIATCLKGMPYIQRAEAKRVLEWSTEENCAHQKMRAAAIMVRRIAGNNAANLWLSDRLSTGWWFTIAGLAALAISTVIRLVFS